MEPARTDVGPRPLGYLKSQGRLQATHFVILLIDNYDSFVHNLARYFVRLGQETRVVRHDAITVDQLRELALDAIVISPGPCGPAEAGCSVEVVRACWQTTPILGVCLGHQAIAAAFGAAVAKARQPWHGRSSVISHNQQGVFAGLPSPMTVGRYHSLAIVESSLPPDLLVTARTDDGEIMAIQHAERQVVGVQFHPESVLTEHGAAMLTNFLQMAGLPTQEISERAEVLSSPEIERRMSVGGVPVSF